MRKIGIYTFWNVPNYGAFMQAYALQRAVSGLFPEDDVRQIGYLDARHYDTYYRLMNWNFRYALVNPHFYKQNLSRWLHRNDIAKVRGFQKYYECIPHFDAENESALEQMDLDAVVLGSDIIWDFSMPVFNHDRHLFGLGFNAKKLISYAPSCGTAKETQQIPEYVKTGLKALASISVRDENSAKIVRKAIGREAEIVADPTLVHDFDQDENIVRPAVHDYILVYGIEFSEKMVRDAKAYAAAHHLQLICLQSGNEQFDWCDKIIRQDELTPFEWAGYFKFANAVMASRYHGLMFALLFKRRIVFYPIPFIMDKASSLIRDLGLWDVLVGYETFEEKIAWKWDYEEIGRPLGALRERSLDYLRNALGE